MLIYIILATFLISLIAFVGILISQKYIKRLLHYFISFAAGTLIAVSFFDLIPHALHDTGNFHESSIFIVLGLVIFFLIERFIHWHHCGKEDCKEKPEGLLILTGDFVHNFIDGLLIAGAFMLNLGTGIFTTITVAIHEIPQEFGDFSVLIHAGYKRKKALLYNFLSALSAVIGGVAGFFIFDYIEGIASYAVLITAGGFIYIALSDIVPSMHRHQKERHVLLIETLIFLATTIGFYFLLEAIH